MKTRAALAIFVLLLPACISAAAGEPRDVAGRVAQLKQKAANAKEKDRAKLLAELIREEASLASQQFDTGNAKDAQATIADIKAQVIECKQAALAAGKDLKHTDIELREAARQLDNLRRSLAFEDQAPVKEVVDLIQDARTAILDRMFGIKEKH